LKATFVVLALTLAGIARGDVADSAPNGFTVKIALTIQASSDEVYRRLVGNIGDWWNSAHTFTGDAHNLTIEAKPMGCFCEKLPSGGARHMEVVNFVPGKTLVMVGGLGPLQSLAVAASMTIQLAPADGATRGRSSDATIHSVEELRGARRSRAEKVNGDVKPCFVKLDCTAGDAAGGSRDTFG